MPGLSVLVVKATPIQPTTSRGLYYQPSLIFIYTYRSVCLWIDILAVGLIAVGLIAVALQPHNTTTCAH